MLSWYRRRERQTDRQKETETDRQTDRAYRAYSACFSGSKRNMASHILTYFRHEIALKSTQGTFCVRGIAEERQTVRQTDRQRQKD